LNIAFEILSLLKTVTAPLRLRISFIVFSNCELSNYNLPVEGKMDVGINDSATFS